ncbi:MAG: hypothetical protein HUU57_06105 [Bdellovibrio sp.]|nr:hypothetical protein [Bdellovibrio sp.]
MKLPSLCLLLACIFTLLSCQTKEEPVTREALLSRGFALLDKGEYDQAITYFAEMAKTDSHRHVRLAWASAYAARAGVQMEQIYSFVVIEEIQKREVFIKGLPAEVRAQTAELMKSLETYVQHWKQIPDLSSAGVADLVSAVQVLDGVTVPGPSLYRATLRVVILKNHVALGLKNWKILTETSSRRLCTKSLRPFFAWGVRVLDVLAGVSEDLQYAFPKNKQDYEKVSQQLKEVKVLTAQAVWPEENLCL